MEAAARTSYTDHFGESFQKHLLAVMVREPGALARFRSALSHEYFTSDIARAVALGLVTYYDKNKHLPTQSTLTQEALDVASSTHKQSIDPFVCKLYDDDVSDAPGVLAKAVEFGKYAALINAVIKAADKADTHRLTVVERGLACKLLLEDALQVGEDIGSMGVDYSVNVAARAQRYLTPELEDDIISTGIRHLDYAIGGGLGRGKLGMIVAPPGRGKSTFLCNLGFYSLLCTATPRTVVHITMEMDDHDVVKKYDDHLVHGVSRLKNNKPDRLEEILVTRVRQYIRGTLFVKRYFTRSAGVSSIRAYLMMLTAHGHKPDLLLVDYADIVKPERRLGDARHEMAGVYEDLRALAGEFDCACWTASQTNRSGAGKTTIDLTDVAESFEKAAIVDVGLLFSQSRDESIHNTCRIHVEKVRNHEDHTIVECEIRRDRAMIRSIGRYDAAYTPIDEDSPTDTRGKTALEQHLNQNMSQNNRDQRQHGRPGANVTRRVGNSR